ncbi:MAG: DUF421 domain-containing protein [Oscillospiraceae bacterium]|nr:DUF421 domain-containing protein [Oscillospiraceae bacterium]
MAAAFVRTCILYIVIVIALRMMGKRQIGEMEPSELVITILISELAAIPMQDSGKPLLAGVLPILVLLSLQLLLSCSFLKSELLCRLFQGRSAVLIEKGKINERAMRDNRVTLTELIERLRTKDVTDISTVQYAVLETNGQLSVIVSEAHKPPSTQVWLDSGGNITNESIAEGGFPQMIVKDGNIEKKILKKMGLDYNWLVSECKARGAKSPGQVFLMTRDNLGRIYFLKKEKYSGVNHK